MEALGPTKLGCALMCRDVVQTINPSLSELRINAFLPNSSCHTVQNYFCPQEPQVVFHL